jgi:hypothetical protein
VTLAINAVAAAMSFIAANPNLAAAPATVAPARPNFTPAAADRGQFPAREGVLNNLAAAFDALTRTPGGDLGGFRARIYSAIAVAAADVNSDIHSLAEERRKQAAAAAGKN